MAQKQRVVGGAGPLPTAHCTGSCMATPAVLSSQGECDLFYTYCSASMGHIFQTQLSFLTLRWLLIEHSLFPPLFIMLLEALVWSLAHFGLA